MSIELTDVSPVCLGPVSYSPSYHFHGIMAIRVYLVSQTPRWKNLAPED